MTGNFFRAAARNLLRHKVQTLIHVASLAIGLMVFGFAFLYVKEELSYDRLWPDAERIHRLTIERRNLPGTREGVDTGVAFQERARILDYFADDIEASTRQVGTVAWFSKQGERQIGLTLVDAQFLDVFELEAVEGDIGRALSGPGFVAIEETMALNLGLSGRTGERFTIGSFYDNTASVEYELAAIYRLPRPTSITPLVISLMHEYSLPLFSQQAGRRFLPWESTTPLWVKLRDGVDSAAFNARQPAFVEGLTTYAPILQPNQKVTDHVSYVWQPLTDMHFNPVGFESGSLLTGDLGRVGSFAAVGLLVLLVGCSNSISLSLAAALERRREIGVRKAAGALPRDIMAQQLGESVLLALLALVPAIAALELLHPAIQALLPFSVRAGAGGEEYPLLGLIAVLVGLCCGAYPALVLSQTRPQAVLRAGAQPVTRRGLSLRTLLVALQFSLASVLLIGTAALFLQLAVARAQPLGFNADNIVLTIENDGVSADVMRAEFARVPGVRNVLRGFTTPSSSLPAGINAQTFVRNSDATTEVRPELVMVDFGFIELMQINLLAGRDFDPRFDMNPEGQQISADNPRRVLLNETAAREFGFARPQDAVEQTVFLRTFFDGKIVHTPMRVLGVVENNQYVSLRRRPGPEAYMLMGVAGTQPGNLFVQFEDAAEAGIRDRLLEAAQRLNNAPLNGILFLEQQIDNAYLQERNESRLLLICGGLALLLASIGLYGLAAFALERQVKEVGVRKVMGASVAAILGLYLWRFARPIVAANLVAWPVAIYFVLQWIERFPYQMERAWLAPLCIAVLGAVLLIATLTVSVITTRAASTNPVRSLRYE